MLHAGWALAAPYNGPPDEMQHVYRAAGIMHGDFVAEKDPLRDWTVVPNSLIRGWCFPTKLEVTPDCDVEPGGADQSLQRYQTTAARYNPVYYMVTAWPLGPWPNWGGVMLSRLLTAAAVAALLAAAVVGASRWTRHRALVAGIIVAATPMTAHLGGSINPSAVEIAAGVALFTALIALVHEQRDGINRAAVTLAGISGAVLVTPRFTGIMWLAVILGAVLIPSPRARLRVLVKSRLVRIWSAVVAVASAAALAWTFGVGTTNSVAWDHGMTTKDILRSAMFDMWPNLTTQMVGVMGWAELLMPRLIYVAWWMAVGLLLLGGLALGRAVDRWRMLALFFATFTPLITLELLTANGIGFFNQGRYFLPGAVGLPLLGAYILARRGFTAEHLRSTTRVLAILLLPIHFVCLAYSMTRWDSGLRSLNPFNGSWQPPYGAALPLICGGVGVVVLFLAYWRASRIPVEPPTPEREEELPMAAPAQPPVSASYV